MSQPPAHPPRKPAGHLSHVEPFTHQQPAATGSWRSAEVSPESPKHGSQHLRSSPATTGAQSAIPHLQQSPPSPDTIDIDSLLAQLQDSATEPSSSPLENLTLSGAQPSSLSASIAQGTEGLKEARRRLEKANQSHQSQIDYLNKQLGHIADDMGRIKNIIKPSRPPLPSGESSSQDGGR